MHYELCLDAALYAFMCEEAPSLIAPRPRKNEVDDILYGPSLYLYCHR